MKILHRTKIKIKKVFYLKKSDLSSEIFKNDELLNMNTMTFKSELYI